MSAVAYFDGLNEKLLAAIPRDARSVLEFGCANGRLGAAGKAIRPGLRWSGVDVNAAALERAAEHLDAVVAMDLDRPDVSRLGSGYDVIVFGDVLEHLRDPSECLRAAHLVSAPDARLVTCIPNMTHVSIFERMLCGDLSYDSSGLLDSTHLRFLSFASSFKLLLNCGWLPHLCDRNIVDHPDKVLLEHLLAAAQRLGLPQQTALNYMLSYQLIIDCIKAPAPRKAATTPFSVVVPVTNPLQFELNVCRSPGLDEVDAEVIPIEGAGSAGEAFTLGLRHATNPWVVFCHQDVYFPCGSGHTLAACFEEIPPADAAGTLIGFAGLVEQSGQVCASGLVTDRSYRFDHAASLAPISMDEFAIAVSKDTVHSVDPALGWHLWATDLCLAARYGRGGSLRIERVPLFHNSYNDGQLPASIQASAEVLWRKYPQAGPISTMCGTIMRTKIP